MREGPYWPGGNPKTSPFLYPNHPSKTFDFLERRFMCSLTEKAVREEGKKNTNVKGFSQARQGSTKRHKCGGGVDHQLKRQP